MYRVCTFLMPVQMLNPLKLNLEDAICGKPAEWELALNDLEPMWVCSEHYDVLIAQGWSEHAPGR
jgi:hypothetical protein